MCVLLFVMSSCQNVFSFSIIIYFQSKTGFRWLKLNGILTIDIDIITTITTTAHSLKYSTSNAWKETCLFAFLFSPLLSAWINSFEQDLFAIETFCSLFNYAKDKINLPSLISWPFQVLHTPLSYTRSLVCLQGLSCTTNSMKSLARPCISTESTSCSWALTGKKIQKTAK